jgi:hypothetical protein
MFGPRRGARTRQRVFNLLVRRSDGTSVTITLDAMARALGLCKMTVWRSTLWLRARGLILKSGVLEVIELRSKADLMRVF